MRGIRAVLAAGLVLALFATAPAQAESRILSITAGPLLNAEEKVYAPDGQTVTCSTSNIAAFFIVDWTGTSADHGEFISNSSCGLRRISFLPGDCSYAALTERLSCINEAPTGEVSAVAVHSFHPMRVMSGFVEDSESRLRWEFEGLGLGSQTPA